MDAIAMVSALPARPGADGDIVFHTGENVLYCAARGAWEKVMPDFQSNVPSAASSLTRYEDSKHLQRSPMIEVTHYYGVHEGGTKDYHLTLFHSKKTGKAIIVKRYGKTGTDGQIKVDLARGNGSETLNKFLRERASKGYDMRHDMLRSFTAPDVATALDVLPRRHRGAISAAQINLLDSDLNDFDPFRAEREQKFSSEISEAARKQAEREAEKARRDQEELEAASQLPNAGIF